MTVTYLGDAPSKGSRLSEDVVVMGCGVTLGLR